MNLEVFVKGYEFLFFARNRGINITKNISQNLNSKYNHKLLHHAKQSVTDVFKIASKRAIQQVAGSTGSLTYSKYWFLS